MRNALLPAAVLSLLACAALAQQAPAEPADPLPSIIVLMSDDAGFADFGFQPGCAADCRELTPRIDSLAAAGARFTDACATGAVCSPTRAGMLTGRYQQRFGHERNIPAGSMTAGLDPAERTLGDRLGALGLATGYVGKWHLGYADAFHPNRRGFAHFHGLLQGSRPYGTIERDAPHQVLQVNGKLQPEAGYVTDRFGDAAAAFVKEHAKEPFVLFVSFTAPHGPLQPLAADLATVPESVPAQRRKNLGLLVGLDRAVGRILDAVEEAGIRDRTLVVFTNDNGGQVQTGADNGPLRGAKGTLYEGGIRVPLAVRWPQRIRPGTVVTTPVALFDLLPTFVAATGARVDADWRLDGRDLLPLLAGDPGAVGERALFFRTNGPKGPVAMRRGVHKLVYERNRAGSEPELYDLSRDPGEASNLAAAEPERLAAMLAEIATWEAQLVDPRW